MEVEVERRCCMLTHVHFLFFKQTQETHAEYVNGNIQLVGGCIM